MNTHTTHTISSLLLITLLGITTACGGGEGSNEAFSTTTTSSGSLLTSVNATDEDQWVYVDLDDADTFISSADSPRWDLGFKRQLIQVNNDDLVAIAVLDDISFAQVDGAPTADKFFNDASKDEDDLAFSQERGWYSYNLLKHKLSARQPRTYIVRSTEGTLFKLSFEDYYDDEGNGGYVSFEWARVDGKKIIMGKQMTPCSDEEAQQTIKDAMGDFDTASQGTLTLSEPSGEGIITATLDASIGGPEQAAQSSYLYIDLVAGELLSLSDKQAAQSEAWHIAIKRSELRANSADSGPGQIHVALQDQELSKLTNVPLSQDDTAWRRDDFVDEFCNVKTFGLDFIETSFGQWYEYDFENHVARVKPEQTYIIQDRQTNTSWGFTIDAFDAGQYTMRWKQLDP
jgi:hypothetical protein